MIQAPMKVVTFVTFLFLALICEDTGSVSPLVQENYSFLSINEMVSIQGGIAGSAGTCTTKQASDCNYCIAMSVGECVGYLGYCQLDGFDAACVCGAGDIIFQLACL